MTTRAIAPAISEVVRVHVSMEKVCQQLKQVFLYARFPVFHQANYTVLYALTKSNDVSFIRNRRPIVPSSMAHTMFRCFLGVTTGKGLCSTEKKNLCVGLFVFFTQVALQRVCRAVDRTSSYTLPGTGNGGHEAALEKSTTYACRPARCWSYVHKLMGHIPIRRARVG
jgi:hypothetical protein